MSDQTDRELLEMAAKAAGITIKPMEVKNVTAPGDDRWIGHMTDPAEWPRGWFDPLTDDGDAFRLAVKLGMVIVIDSDGMTQVIAGYADTCEPLGSDPYAATRRAIVRAAAALTQGA